MEENEVVLCQEASKIEIEIEIESWIGRSLTCPPPLPARRPARTPTCWCPCGGAEREGEREDKGGEGENRRSVSS